ncbi:MAG TPA: dTDP-4-dehydrorhamnose 3,5-epimerase [Thermoanaerobaculia bacterium]|nr:dTDP-4-dehydrorhamnose 3,5-epimerase [Thermoanaerobaculia bacterium]
MKFKPTRIPEVFLIEPQVFRDERGYFLETYHLERYREGGLPEAFVQDNHSFSTARVLRGLHAQLHRPQGKLVRAVQGEIFDVAVDIRPDSPSFGQWAGEHLTGDNFRQLYIPPGFAHGFCVLSETAHVTYKCTDFYDPKDEITVVWNDPDIGIRWPIDDYPILNIKDRDAPRLADIVQRLTDQKSGR